MSPRRGGETPPPPDVHKHISPDQAPAGETPQQKSERRLEHLRRLGKIHDDLEAIEAFRTSPFMESLSEEERKTQTREMYARVLGKYRPFLERVNMEDGQREKALAALQLEGTEAMGPGALHDHVLRVARKVERTVARAIHATQAERTVLRKEAAKHRVTEFTFAKERSSGAKGKMPYREAKDAPNWPVPLGGKTTYVYQGGAISGGGVLEKTARKVHREEKEPSDLPAGRPEREPEDPIKVAKADERRMKRDVGVGYDRPVQETLSDLTADTSYATDTTDDVESVGDGRPTQEGPPTVDAEFEVVEEDVGTGRDPSTQEAMGDATPTESGPAVDLGEPTPERGHAEEVRMFTQEQRLGFRGKLEKTRNAVLKELGHLAPGNSNRRINAFVTDRITAQLQLAWAVGQEAGMNLDQIGPIAEELQQAFERGQFDGLRPLVDRYFALIEEAVEHLPLKDGDHIVDHNDGSVTLPQTSKKYGTGGEAEDVTEDESGEAAPEYTPPPTIDAEFEVVEPEDNGERGVVLANPDVVDAEFDDREQLVQEAIELAGGGGGQEPPRNADAGFDVDEEEMKPANDPRYGRGSGGAGVAAGVVGAGVAAAASGGGGGGGGRRGVWASTKAAASAVGRFIKGGVQGGSGDLWRGIMSYEFARTVKRWTHAAGTVTFDWTDSILKKIQDIAHSASFSWLPFSSKWSKEDRDSITDLKPEDKKKAA